MPADAPKIENAPGLVWRQRKRQQLWVATWQCRSDLAALGYKPNRLDLWQGRKEELGPDDVAFITKHCQDLQGDMLVYSRGGVPELLPYDGTLKGLAVAYLNNGESNFSKLRYHTRKYYNTLIKRIVEDHGAELVRDTRAKHMKMWHENWTHERGVAMSHALMGMLRTLFGFGATFVEDEECERLCAVLHRMKFKMPAKREEALTAEQAITIRAEAHKRGLHSIALAQAIQFECTFRQKDVIGEWVPQGEPGLSDVIDDRGRKWLRGIRWEEIDADLILRHTTSKRQKPIEINLNLAPMVMEELALLSERPTKGPIIVSEKSKLPWYNNEFRRYWRKCATAVGVPSEVKNMDSRAGAISEATDAGAPLEHVRHAATHSNIQTTQGYSRNSRSKVDNVMQIRAASRQKNT